MPIFLLEIKNIKIFPGILISIVPSTIPIGQFMAKIFILYKNFQMLREINLYQGKY